MWGTAQFSRTIANSGSAGVTQRGGDGKAARDEFESPADSKEEEDSERSAADSEVSEDSELEPVTPF